MGLAQLTPGVCAQAKTTPLTRLGCVYEARKTVHLVTVLGLTLCEPASVVIVTTRSLKHVSAPDMMRVRDVDTRTLTGQIPQATYEFVDVPHYRL